MGLFILVFVLFLLSGFGWIYSASHRRQGLGVSSFLVLILCAFALIVIGGCVFGQYPQNVKEFIYEKPFVQGQENQLLIEKRDEWNRWLARAQVGKEMFGWFSLQPDEVLTLTPIE